MYEITAHAIRIDGTIEVTVTGMLPTSCHQASIADIYPGGNIMYVVDPGEAQVFIKETVQPGTIYCAMVLIPWAGTTKIPDKQHDSVDIFVNRQFELNVTVVDVREDKFIVLQLTGGIIPNGPYSIVPADALYLPIYTQVFGPATYAECEQYIHDQPKLPFEILDGVAIGYGGAAKRSKKGGGGGSPHGLLEMITENGGSGNPRGL